MIHFCFVEELWEAAKIYEISAFFYISHEIYSKIPHATFVLLLFPSCCLRNVVFLILCWQKFFTLLKEGNSKIEKKRIFQLFERKLNINLKHTFSFRYCCFWSSDCLFHNFQFFYVFTQTDIDTDRDCNQKEL